MKFQQPIWCARCRQEITPADLRTVYQLVDYHRDCFHLLVREEAEQQKKSRSARASVGEVTVQSTSTK